MIYTTTETVPGKEIEAVLGIVNGNMVKSKHVGRDIMAGLKGIVGGELKGYTEMLMEARNVAVERLIEDAKKLNADAIVGIRFTTSSVTDGASEILVFGTAVKLRT